MIISFALGFSAVHSTECRGMHGSPMVTTCGLYTDVWIFAAENLEVCITSLIVKLDIINSYKVYEAIRKAERR